ncbi:nuclear transport factor 2 family protein [Nonomuraea pusilla]|uniref:YybH family protein n=1 Tax=Nonomuraea pusilla TaxID=46177 RepID=UPI00332948C2
MSTISQRKALLLAAVIPAFLVAGCGASGNPQAMKGAESQPTESMMPTESGTESMSPTESGPPMMSPSPTGTVKGGKVGAVVMAYFDAVKSGNVDEIMKLFLDTAVVELDGVPTAEGSSAVRKVIQQQVQSGQHAQGTHTIDEVHTVGGEDAFVRTTSTMQGQTMRAFFILTKQDNGKWKIARLMSNKG